MADYTMDQIDYALRQLGHYRVVRAQERVYQNPYGIRARHLLALGLRETGLRNICGGGSVVDGKWVPAKTDRGWLQISDKYHADFLKNTPGCPEGQWRPLAGHTAYEPTFVPRYTDSLDYTVDNMGNAIEYGKKHGVSTLIRFAITAHNAGIGGAMDGYRAGDIDKYTTHGDYSAWVIRHSALIKDWISAHPYWQYHV